MNNTYRFVDGGITAPKGFTAGAKACDVKGNRYGYFIL